MYIDFNQYDYSLIDESSRSAYIERDKAAYKEILKEWLNSNADDIVDRKWSIENIFYLSYSSDFIRLLKEAENLFEFGFYTGCIALIGICAEDFTKLLASKWERDELVDKTQYQRINILKNEGLITDSIHSSLDAIRKIRRP